MKYKGYNRMFWGALLVIFSMNLGSLVIFPDIVGYFMIATGVGYVMMENKNQAAKLVKWMSWGTVLGEAIKELFGYVFYDATLLGQGSALVIGIMILVMRYSLLEVEKELGRYNQNVYLAFHTVVLIGISFSLNLPFLWGITGILSMITEGYWLLMLYELRKDARLEK